MKIRAINKQRGGIEREFTEAIWKIISKNPLCPWVAIGTKQPIDIPPEVVKKKVIAEAVEEKKPEVITIDESRKEPTMKDMSAYLKEKNVKIPFGAKEEIKSLYDDNQK